MKLLSTFILLFYTAISFGQLKVEGFVFETGNRGYISNADVVISNSDKTQIFARAKTDASGMYHATIPVKGNYLISIQRAPFVDFSEFIQIEDANTTTYLKHEITKKPGYVFEITLAEKDIDPDAAREGLHGALVEVYNNTTKTEELVIPDLQSPDFKVNFIKGNHYTILVRKDGFLSKRMEAFVDVEGCILCFEGIGQVTPGVSDNLTESNTMGVLLANVAMDRYFEGKVIGLQDIYYETDKSRVTRKGAIELNKISGFLVDNPELSIELGAHTDSRGKAQYNLELSEKRAQSAVEYLISKRGVDKSRIFAQGYGETNLTNKCSDNVKCSDLEHAANRRTELKILKVSGEHIQRSLRQMKADELLDEILQEISEEGEIRVPEDGTIEDVLTEKEQENSNSIRKSTRVLTQEIPTESTPDSNDKSDLIEMSHGSEGISEKNLLRDNTSIENHNSSRYSSSYTGYKIVLHFSRFELPNAHPLFAKFPDLDVYTTADGNKLYMIESHQNRKSAEDRLRKRFISSFPSAYVIGFENGIITD